MPNRKPPSSGRLNATNRGIAVSARRAPANAARATPPPTPTSNTITTTMRHCARSSARHRSHTTPTAHLRGAFVTPPFTHIISRPPRVATHAIPSGASRTTHMARQPLASSGPLTPDIHTQPRPPPGASTLRSASRIASSPGLEHEASDRSSECAKRCATHRALVWGAAMTVRVLP